jgi:hypothetical protein
MSFVCRTTNTVALSETHLRIRGIAVNFPAVLDLDLN